MEEEIGQKGQNTFSDAVHFYSHKTYLDWIKKKFAVHVMEYSVQNRIFLTLFSFHIHLRSKVLASHPRSQYWFSYRVLRENYYKYSTVIVIIFYAHPVL